MKKIWSNYKQTIILLGSLINGAIAGLIFKEKCEIVKPLGDLFLNMMFVVIVPLIFLTITTSIAKIKQPKRLGKVLTSIIGVFIITSIVAVVIGLATTYSFKLVKTNDSATILESLGEETEEKIELNILERTVSAISTTDFVKILSRDNLIALVVISILVGIAINKVGKDGEKLEEVLSSANKVVLKLVDIIFLYAPIGLGCYFAALIGTFGNEIAIGYAKTFAIYTILAIAYYFIIYSLYAIIAGGKKGFVAFWKNIIPATATSISTCSSAASIPANIKCSKNIGVSDDIAETIIPLGTSFHKDGSIIGSVFKIMFLAYLFGTNVHSFNGVSNVIITALIANLLVMAVPVGGGTISEMLILTMMDFPIAALPILTIIATIIDPPATLLNVVGDTSSSMLTARIIDGKDWMKKTK
ncbi:MAG: dicarboxylate/amino acid:cation symporter [Bacilli bacterium]